jgi:hypothetical protein
MGKLESYNLAVYMRLIPLVSLATIPVVVVSMWT